MFSLTYVGGRPDDDDGVVGSSGVRMMCIGRSGQSSSPSRSTVQGRSVGLRPWLNQSLIMNCSQAAMIALPASAATRPWSRVSSRRLTVRGFGSLMVSALSCQVRSIGTLRPNRVPAMPMVGLARSFHDPSGLRWSRKAGSKSGATGPSTTGCREVSKRLPARSLTRIPSRSRMPTHLGSRGQPRRWSTRCARAV